MIIHETGGNWLAMADDLSDLQRWIVASPRKWRSNSSHKDAARDNWDLNLGYEGAVAMAKTGWHDGAMKIDNLVVNERGKDRTSTWRYDVAGERPDVGRYLSGDPACMMRHGHPKGNKPVITIAANIGAMGSVTATSKMYYGAAIVAIVDKLEHSGKRVEFIANSCATMDDKSVFSLSWMVKQADDHLDLAALAFSVAHPACHRRLVFAARERCTLKEPSAYGRIRALTTDWLIYPSPNTLCIPGLYDTNIQSLNQAMKLVAEQINSAAGEELVTLE